MCKECGYYRCPSSCPNAEDPKPVFFCKECGRKLFTGDAAYKIDGNIYCDDCVCDSYFTVD